MKVTWGGLRAYKARGDYEFVTVDCAESFWGIVFHRTTDTVYRKNGYEWRLLDGGWEINEGWQIDVMYHAYFAHRALGGTTPDSQVIPECEPEPDSTDAGCPDDLLLPCPFCGGPARLYGYNFTNDVSVGCTIPECGASIDGLYTKAGEEVAALRTEADAIAAWNQRVSQVGTE